MTQLAEGIIDIGTRLLWQKQERGSKNSEARADHLRSCIFSCANNCSALPLAIRPFLTHMCAPYYSYPILVALRFTFRQGFRCQVLGFRRNASGCLVYVETVKHPRTLSYLKSSEPASYHTALLSREQQHIRFAHAPLRSGRSSHPRRLRVRAGVTGRIGQWR